MTFLGRAMRMGANAHAALYRRLSFDAVRHIAGLPVLLLTVEGRRSGRPLTTPVVYLEHQGGYAVTATGGGSAREPQWFRNLRATDHASIEVGAAKHEVSVRVTEGAERDALWQRFLTEGTTFGTYEKKTDRVFPIAVLTPR